jgi:uncharacterized C2H2 Zn-finger protein
VAIVDIKRWRGAVCDGCDAAGGNLLRCGRCKKVSYCSKECQRAAWKSHKKKCEYARRT